MTTITTRIYTMFCGQFVGNDAFGNRYFRRAIRTRDATDKRAKEKRWAMKGKRVFTPVKLIPSMQCILLVLKKLRMRVTWLRPLSKRLPKGRALSPFVDG